ncbi:MAG: ribokinase [Aeromicrobium sp.]|nr:ribokinase [Aeromicrobium sp.]
MDEVIVVGSINVDRAVEVPEALQRGATLLGGAVHRGPGGKGANQAVALARLGRSVGIVGAVGSDADGAWMLEVLEGEGVDVAGVHRSESPTGQAFVFVEPGGESTIVVAPGANGALTPSDMDAIADRLRGARCVLAQQEVPSGVVARAAELCGGVFVLNPAPARPLPAEVLVAVDVLVPNRHELAGLAGQPGTEDIATLERMARSLRGPDTVIVTLGEEGALVVPDGTAVHVAAVPVDAVDATAAGDTFCAALVDALLDGADAVEATRWAVLAASVAVGRRGAMDSIPHRSDIRAR